MTTCCPNCASTDALGAEALTACMDCGAVAVAGLSFPTAAMIVGVGLVVATLAIRGIVRVLDGVPAKA